MFLFWRIEVVSGAPRPYLWINYSLEFTNWRTSKWVWINEQGRLFCKRDLLNYILKFGVKVIMQLTNFWKSVSVDGWINKFICLIFRVLHWQFHSCWFFLLPETRYTVTEYILPLLFFVIEKVCFVLMQLCFPILCSSLHY